MGTSCMAKTRVSLTERSLRSSSTKWTASSRASAWWYPGFPSASRKMTMWGIDRLLCRNRASARPEAPLRGVSSYFGLRDQGQVHDVTERRAVGWVAGEERRRGGGRLHHDEGVLGADDFGSGDDIDRAHAVHGEHHVVAGHELVD